MLRKRRGGLPPIVTVLIVLAAVASAGLVTWFMISSTSAAVKQPVLQITEAYAVGTVLRINVKNVGGATAYGLTLVSPSCTSGGTLTPGTFVPRDLPPGQTATVTITGSSNFADGTQCVVTIQYSTGAVSLTLRAVSP